MRQTQFDLRIRLELNISLYKLHPILSTHLTANAAGKVLGVTGRVIVAADVSGELMRSCGHHLANGTNVLHVVTFHPGAGFRIYMSLG